MKKRAGGIEASVVTLYNKTRGVIRGDNFSYSSRNNI